MMMMTEVDGVTVLYGVN